MVRARGAGVHAVTFQLKRAHLCAVAMGRSLFRGKVEENRLDGVLDMTPARFDLLFVVWKTPLLSQRGICERLGLHSSTISQAVGRLVELGLIKCERVDGFDRRTRRVWLTDEGLRRFKRALHLVFTGRSISRHLRAFVGQYVNRKRRGLKARIDEQQDVLWQELIHLAKHLGNRAALVHELRYEPDH
jgi:DNA-binding MarR family transcriptional regulator